MHLSNWSFIPILVCLLATVGCSDSDNHRRDAIKEYTPVPSTYQLINMVPYWEHILREFIFKTISPSPASNHALYKGLLEAPFYGGPFPTSLINDTSIVLSRGDVYYLPNNQWMLCQEGCIECDVCADQSSPTVKWILRRIKRILIHGSPRYDLQLTILPQADGTDHMQNLGPHSYIYVTSQGEHVAYLKERSGNRDHRYTLMNIENSSTDQGRRTIDFWRIPEDSTNRYATLAENDVANTQHSLVDIMTDNIVATATSVGTVGATTETATQYSSTFRKPGRRLRPKSTERPITGDPSMSASVNDSLADEKKQLLPKLILGTDGQGQKHLVHFVPAEQPTTTTILTRTTLSSPSASPEPAPNQGLTLNEESQEPNRVAYQRMMHRIFESLNDNRQSIEDFLEPSRRLDPNQGLLETVLGQPTDVHRRQETGNGFAGLKVLSQFQQEKDEVSPRLSGSSKQLPRGIRWNRQRRKVNRRIYNNSARNHTDVGHRCRQETQIMENIIAEINGNVSVISPERALKNVSVIRSEHLCNHSHHDHLFNFTQDSNVIKDPLIGTLMMATDLTSELSNKEEHISTQKHLSQNESLIKPNNTKFN